MKMQQYYKLLSYDLRNLTALFEVKTFCGERGHGLPDITNETLPLHADAYGNYYVKFHGQNVTVVKFN